MKHGKMYIGKAMKLIEIYIGKAMKHNEMYIGKAMKQNKIGKAMNITQLYFTNGFGMEINKFLHSNIKKLQC